MLFATALGVAILVAAMAVAGRRLARSLRDLAALRTAMSEIEAASADALRSIGAPADER